MTSARSLRHRWIALVVLAFWVAPALGALAVGLHLTLGHHHHGDHDHGSSHQATALDLALAAVHGHDHGSEAVPDHDHPAPVTGGPSIHPGAATAVDLVPAVADPPLLVAALERLSSPRRGPPIPLFETHCSLLL